MYSMQLKITASLTYEVREARGHIPQQEGAFLCIIYIYW